MIDTPAEIMLWNIVLTAIIGFIGWSLKEKTDELNRIQVLLNRTREEVAKDYVTKSEVHADINRVLESIRRLDEKIERMMSVAPCIHGHQK